MSTWISFCVSLFLCSLYCGRNALEDVVARHANGIAMVFNEVDAFPLTF